ncbi:hypothetical protein C0J52_03056 [Blattella germanica]|nr:hypothetical protein C0J52_03056 [Blattella germanica]
MSKLFNKTFRKKKKKKKDTVYVQMIGKPTRIQCETSVKSINGQYEPFKFSLVCPTFLCCFTLKPTQSC